MAVDQGLLWSQAFPQWASYGAAFVGRPFIDRLRLGGTLLFEKLGAAAWLDGPPNEVDTIRAWRAFSVAAAALPLQEGLHAIHSFAADEHFAVREWAWLSLRPDVCREPHAAIALLAESSWERARWRRFVSEITRPRSVWGRHICELKRRPQDAEALVRRLLNDDDQYVLVSVTNWLNDISVEHHPWVLGMCQQVSRPERGKADWILRRATRRAIAQRSSARG